MVHFSSMKTKHVACGLLVSSAGISWGFLLSKMDRKALTNTAVCGLYYIEIILRTVRVNIPKLGGHVVILLRNPESSMASIED